jgi:hypothetical protein
MRKSTNWLLIALLLALPQACWAHDRNMGFYLLANYVLIFGRAMAVCLLVPFVYSLFSTGETAPRLPLALGLLWRVAVLWASVAMLDVTVSFSLSQINCAFLLKFMDPVVYPAWQNLAPAFLLSLIPSPPKAVLIGLHLPLTFLAVHCVLSEHFRQNRSFAASRSKVAAYSLLASIVLLSGAALFNFKTPWFSASPMTAQEYYGNSKALNRLKEKVDRARSKGKTVPQTELDTGLKAAIYLGRGDLITTFVTKENIGSAVSWGAFYSTKAEVVITLVQLGAPLVDERGNTILTQFRGKEYELNKLLAEPEIVKLINRQNMDGDTALSYAFRSNEDAKVLVLLEAGANPNLPDKKGVTPLAMVAAACAQETRPSNMPKDPNNWAYPEVNVYRFKMSRYRRLIDMLKAHKAIANSPQTAKSLKTCSERYVVIPRILRQEDLNFKP